jgi:hypothetical protein
LGINIDEVEVELNRDFISAQMDSKTLIDMIKAYQDGGISEDTLYYNLHRGEILPPDHNKQEEIQRLQGLIKPVEQSVEQPVMDQSQGGQAMVHDEVTDEIDMVGHLREMIEQGLTDDEILELHPELGRLFNQNNI